MKDTKQREWVMLSSGVKVGLPTKEEMQIMKQVTKNLAPNYNLRREMSRKQAVAEREKMRKN